MSASPDSYPAGTSAASLPERAFDPGALLEQYKVYAEMADRVSTRRTTSNTIFLALNTSVLTLAGTLVQAKVTGNPWMLLVPTIVLVAQCMAWSFTCRSYQVLNRAKYHVIQTMECSLPFAPWTREWEMVRAMTSKYSSTSRLEQVLPVAFALAYIAGFGIVLATR